MHLDDVNKNKRNSMWWVFVISLITIPVFILFDNRQISESDLEIIDPLILAQDAYYNPGGGKGSTPSLRLNVTATDRTLVINYEEYSCVSNNDILDNFKHGDTISIKIDKSNLDNFYSTTFLSKFVKLYGLTKKGQDYISLTCRNEVSTRNNNAGIIASSVSAILSLAFALFILQPKTKYQAYGQFPFDPFLIVTIVWLFLYIAFK